MQNTLFGGESATDHVSQSFNVSNNILLGATVSAKHKSKMDKSYFYNRLFVPIRQADNFSAINNFKQGKNKTFPVSINQWISAFLVCSTIFIQKHLLMPLISLNTSTWWRIVRFNRKTESWRYYKEFCKLHGSPLPWQ